MSDIAIRVENLGKAYRIASNKGAGRYRTLRDDLLALPKTLWATLRGKQEKYETVWALQDVSFDVRVGEVIGVIGRNGAGKSTLLKLLSRITEPTKGRAEIYGRVGSLLEIGTGFHAELTGRENVFLSGAVLGMTRREVQEKFDEIVAFAEVEKFIDDPVKHYSSGMYMRLAFAVAAHLEPEVLVVDEVLAVGDMEFQKKCLGKMGEVAKTGRTVLFVSHNMGAIRALCTSVIVMKNGLSGAKKPVDEGILEYSCVDTIETMIFPIARDEVILHDFSVMQRGYMVSDFDGDSAIDILIEYELTQDLNSFRIGFFLTTPSGDLILRSLLADWEPSYENMPKGHYKAFCRIPSKYLAAGNYILSVHSSRYGIKDYGFNSLAQKYITITIPSNFNQQHIGERSFGIILLDPNWCLEKQN